MVKIFKIVSLLGTALVFFLGLLLFAFYYLIEVGEIRRFLISEVEKRTHLKVELGEAELQMGWVVGISFRDFSLSKPEDSRPVITAQRILIRVALKPLLERRMVFHQIRLYQPVLQVARDEGGKISLLNLRVHFPFQKQEEAQFTFDLQKIEVEKGEVIFVDHRGNRDPIATHFRQIDLSLRPVRANDLVRSGFEAPPNISTQVKRQLALEFGLKTAIEKDGKHVRLASKGKILFPKGAFELRKVWFDADTHLEALPAGLFRGYYSGFLPVKAIRGILSSSLRWRGSLAQRLHVKGEIDFEQLEIDATDTFTGVLAPGDGRLQLEVEWTPQEIRFPRLDLRSEEISLAAQGSIRSLTGKDSYLEVNLSTPFLPILAVRKYISLRALKSTRWDYLVETVDQGELSLTKAGVAGRLSEIRRLFEPGFENHVWFDAEVRNGGANLPEDRYFPVRGVSGRIVLERGVLYYRSLKGTYGLSRLAEIEGRHDGILTGRGALELRIRGEMDLGELREQSKMGVFPARVANLTASVQELSGKGKFVISVRKEFASPYRIEGQISLENARLRMDDLSLSEIQGDLFLSPKEIHVDKATGFLSGSPLSLRVSLRNYLADKADFDLEVSSPGVEAGVVTRILLSAASAQAPGRVRGTIRYRGSLNSPEDRKLSGSLELLGVQLPLKLFSQPLSEVVGKVRFDGKAVDFHDLKGRVNGSRFEFSGQWRYSGKPQLTFTFSSSEMDLGRLLSQIDAGSDDWYDRLEATGTVLINKGRFEGFEFSDLKTDLMLDKRLWHLDNFSARSMGGTIQGIGSIDDSDDRLRFSTEPKIKAVPVQGLLGWFDIGTREITGNVYLNGKLESRGSTKDETKRNLTGNFHLEIKDGIAKRLPLLVRILNLMDLTRWFSFQLPDLNQEGIRFRSVTGDFRVKKGIYSTENLLVDSDDISITMSGQFDGPNEVIDAVFALRPFPRVGSAVSYIPLIGPGIAGIKDSIMVASFHVKGPVKNPSITPAPLSTLSEFFSSALKIPQKLITIPGTGKK